MGIVVQKFGGSSVSSTEKIYNVCKHIIKEYKKGNRVVVVVSAQGKMTDSLLSQVSEITDIPNKREQDALISVGEQISSCKLVLCLQELGYEAVSFLRMASSHYYR